MNKNKIIMCAIGGVALISSGVLGWLLLSANEDRSGLEDDFEVSVNDVRKINSGKVAPVKASVDAFDANRNMLEDWREEALAIASRGDFTVDKSLLSSESFKSRMVEDAKTLSALPGGVAGKLVKEGFGFGFKDYIVGGSMPDGSRVAAMQRQWSDITQFVGMLSANGVVELLDVSVVPQKAPPRQAEEPRRGAKGEKAEAAKPAISVETYDLKFLARPQSLVRVMNALSNAERFMTVDSFGFGRAEDTLQSVVGGGKEKAEQKRGRNGRGRGRTAKDEEKKDEELDKKGLVTDPLMDAPMTVTVRVSTYDFGTKEAK